MNKFRLSLPKLILFFVSFVACESENAINPVPSVQVDAKVDMNLAHYNIEIDEAIMINSLNYNKLNSAYLGYDDNGIIIYRVGENNYAAYDATCPFDIANNKSVAVQIKEGFCKCPSCKSEFYFVNNAEPTIKSSAKYGLRKFNLYIQGYKIIHVVN